MTTPDPQPGPESPRSAGEPSPPDRVFRSSGGIAGGVLVLALAAWLGIDALVRGDGRTRVLVLAALLFIVPLVVAFTIRPAVYANDNRLRVRNPFRTILLPWAAVSGLRSGYSNEVFDQSGAKYQLWAIPVSLRARKKAGRAQLKAGATQARAGATQVRGAAGPQQDPVRAPADRTMNDLREIQEARAAATSAQGEPRIRWAYEIVAPVLVGLVALAVLLGIG